MKFEDNVKDTVVVGDIKSNSVSVDTTNIDFIVTILSTNLYSKPIESFVRETVSNGWDSHVEANVTEPVVLELGINSENEFFCRIQDFGVGLSEERFNTIYRNIGSSTKRSDNTQIGGFGIGRFSALAYSDIVHITSVYHGTKTLYMMYKDGNSISIDTLHKSPTEERNGLCVEVKLKRTEDLSLFMKAIEEQLVYFENLYVLDSLPDSQNDVKNRIKKFNSLKIKKFNNFLVNSYPTKHYNNVFNNVDLVIGKVIYPINTQLIPTEYQSKLINKFWINVPISLKFEIGDLQVTPNREQILYSDSSIKKIGEKAVAASEELRLLAKDFLERDFTSIDEYVKAIGDVVQFPLLEVDGVTKVAILPNTSRKATLNGVKYEERVFKDMYNIFYKKVTSTSFVSKNGKVSLAANSFTSLEHIKARFKDVYYSNLTFLDYYSKAYIREKLEDAIFIPISYKREPLKLYKKTLQDFKNTFENQRTFSQSRYINGITTSLKKWDTKIYKLLFKEMVKNMSKRPVITDYTTIPKSFYENKKKELSLARKNKGTANIDWKENINVGIVRMSQRGYLEAMAENNTISFEKLKKFGKNSLVVYADKGNQKIRSLFSIVRGNNMKPFSNVTFIEVAPSKMKFLKNMENFVSLDSFISTDYKAIRTLGTAYKIMKEIPDLALYNRIQNLDEISIKLAEAVKKLMSVCIDVYKIDKQLLEEIENLCEKNKFYDFELLAVYNENIDLINKSRFLLDFTDNSYSNLSISSKKLPVLLDYILARKLFPVNYETLNKIKNENNQS